MAEDLNLLVSEERIKDMDLETFYNLEDSPKATIDFVAHFVVDEDGKYMPKADAIHAVIHGRQLRDVEEIMNQLRDDMESAAVPKE